MSHDFSKLGFFQTFVCPALVLFLIPVVSLGFFYYAQWSLDQSFLAAFEEGIESDARLTPEEKANALAFFRATPMSTILTIDDPDLRALHQAAPPETQFTFATFRWAIRIAWASIAGGLLMCVLTGLSVLFSLRSQWAQYYSLLAGWHVLRLFCTLEVIAQATLVFALGFWIQAFFFEAYSIKLTLLLGLICLVSIFPVVAAIFRKLDDTFVVEGELLSRQDAPQLWHDLDQLSAQMGIDPPDQVVAGIDDNFFVTQMPITVQGQDEQPRTYRGRTLYVSLSLLKRLQAREAEAVLLHELAHFSGNDTLYTQKIAPLLARYNHYLAGLYNGVVARPVFYCANLFRALYEISLGKLSRQREFRADRLAAEKSSPQDMAHALLRITAYSQYRNAIEQELFEAQQEHQQVNIAERIETGWNKFASAFVETRNVGELATAHPFDSHPPLAQRLAALGYTATADTMRDALGSDELGSWFQKIAAAEELEQEQWSAYEERFRKFHENFLAYRYLPETDQERELVERFFPPVELTAAKDRPVRFDYEKITHEDWDQPVYYREITSMSFENEWGVRVDLKVQRDGKKQTIKLPLSKVQSQQQQVLQTLEQYASRYAAAAAYLQQRQQDSSDESPESTPVEERLPISPQ